MNPRSAKGQALMSALERARNLVSDETRALRAGDLEGLERFAHDKDRALLDITRAGRSMARPDSSLRLAFDGLRTALEENRAALSAHLFAARTLADATQRAIDDAESDRTYSMRYGSGGAGESR